jgi:hypothetical protein
MKLASAFGLALVLCGSILIPVHSFKAAENQTVSFSVLADVRVFIPVFGQGEEQAPNHDCLFSGKPQMAAMMLIAAAIGEVKDLFLVVHDKSTLCVKWAQLRPRRSLELCGGER